MSCVGVSDEAALACELARLKTLYRIQAPELKFSSVKKKPGFLRDLITYLNRAKSPILVEVTDKRFSLCMHIIECLIMPAVSPSDFGQRARIIKNAIADRLDVDLPDHVLIAFCAACQNMTRPSLESAFTALHTWATSFPQEEMMDAILLFLNDTMQDFNDAEPSDPRSVSGFLPVPDIARSGKAVQILPHVPSLLHIYGRLNRLHGGQLKGVRLHHDEQMQFDRALFDGMALAEGAAGKDLPPQPAADFNITVPANLFFKTSHESAAIQAADLLAGAISYCLQTLNASGGVLPPEWGRAFRDLLSLNDSPRGIGVNLVTSSTVFAHIDRIQGTTAQDT